MNKKFPIVSTWVPYGLPADTAYTLTLRSIES